MTVRTLGPRSTRSPLTGTATSAATKADSLTGTTPTTRSRAPAWARPPPAAGRMGTAVTVPSARAAAHTATTAGQGTDGRRQKSQTETAQAIRPPWPVANPNDKSSSRTRCSPVPDRFTGGRPGMALPDIDSSVGHSFGLEFDGVVIKQITEVSGLKIDQDEVELKQDTDSGNLVIKKLLGRPKAGEVTLTRGLTGDNS